MRHDMLRGKIAFVLGLSCFWSIAAAGDPFSVSTVMQKADNGETVLSVSFTVPKQHHLYADRIKVDTAGNIELVPKDIPRPEQKPDQFTGETTGVYEHDVTFLYTVRGGSGAPLEIAVSYQGCSETTCFLPATRKLSVNMPATVPAQPVIPGAREVPAAQAAGIRELAKGFAVAGRATGYMRPAEFIGFLEDSESGRGSAVDRLKGLFERRGAWILAAVLLILAGGLGLNLTPCVLPMIPINIAIIGAGARAGSRGRGFALGGAYGAGITAAYGALGVFVVLTGAKFGILNSSPIFNAAVAAVFFVLSLAMFGVISVDFSRFQGGIPAGGARGRFAAAFAMGQVFSPCLIMWNDPHATWLGPNAGYVSGTNKTGTANSQGNFMDNAVFYGIYGGYKPVPKLDIKAALYYATAQQKPQDTGVNYIDSSYGTEFDLTATYKIYDNLSYMVGLGYLWTGDFFKGTNATAQLQNDYQISHKLTLSF